MRKIELASKFRRDYRRLVGGVYRPILDPDGEFWEVVDALAADIRLPYLYHDHALQGNWEGSRDCHIKPDLVLVYKYVADNILKLERLGSHAEIFGM